MMKLRARGTRVSEAREERAPTLGQEVARLRTTAGMSQHDLAERSGVKRSAISMIELATDGQPGSATLFALSDALGVSVEYWRPYLTPQPPEPPPPPSRGKLK